MRRSIVWFRNDLRLHDNEALTDALGHNDEVIPLYIIDPRTYLGKTCYGFRKTGPYRLKFYMESLHSLRQSLIAAGSNLVVREGYPEEIIPQLAKELGTSFIYCNRERTHEEVLVQDNLEKALWSIGQEIRYYRGKMLYHTADLPFPVTHCPDNFTAFRKEVEKFVAIRKPFCTPESITAISDEIDYGEIPDYTSFDLEKEEAIDSSSSFFHGGEAEALRELKYYLWDTQNLSQYKETRNGLLGRDYSSKFSAHLSKGTLSPKRVYDEIKKYESEVEQNKSTYWLIFELLWRDFFRFMAKKHGNKIFLSSGTKDKEAPKLYQNKTLFDKWVQGRTGIPFIDANMRELNATGFMSNRGRQNVASFLVKDMKIDWLWGAEYFESMLVDYDPCSNYGNWNYVAGVGSDPREDRYFNISLQAKKYDPEGKYMRHWLPELKDAPLEFLFNPFKVDPGDYNHDQIYPNPCVDIKHW